jgi:cytoskeletal protein RodZ
MADHIEQPALAPNIGTGPRLKAARESAGISLAQLSEHTKIPVRMLVLMEAGDFAGLPARTYATGFTRTYAKALGLNDSEYVAAVRAELGVGDHAPRAVPQTFEPGDPSRVPSARFAWLAALAALVVLAAGLFFWRSFYAPAATLPSILPEESATAGPLPTSAPLPAPVVLPTEVATEIATAAPVAPPVVRRAAPRPVATPTATAPAEAPAPAPAAPVSASTAQN